MERKKIKIYSDKKYLTQKDYEPILFPFWGLSPSEKNNPFGGQFDEYIKNGKNYFEMTPIENCDFVVLPEKYSRNKLKEIQPLIDLAQKFNKPILIFFLSDSSEKINIENSYVFRTSLYKKSKEDNEFAMPSWVEDFAVKYFDGKLQIKEKKYRPTISYCGYTKTWKDRVKDILGKNYGTWRSLRYRAIKKLEREKNINTNFIIRTDFWGGAYVSKNKKSPEDLLKLKNKIRQEYIDNLLAGDYAFTTRGNGNFSMRFYEILSLGRIPLFVNTDCVLPYEECVSWDKFCIWVEDYELENMAQKLIDFNTNIDNESFKKLQNEIRNIYEEWISPDGFFKNFYHHFLKNEPSDTQ